ncbi:TPA: acyltransferase family protein, partial [Klebsiella pneumoniae]
GALLFSTKHLWVNRKAAKAAMTVLSFSVLFITGDKSELSLIVLTMVPVLVICMGLSFRDTLIKGKFDISYGVYIYAFPVQQIISNYMPNEFAMSLLSSFVTTTVLALISWFVVERRFLARKNKKINIPPGVIPS